MITSENFTGDWTWEVTAPGADGVRPLRAAELALGVRETLARYELALLPGKGDLRIRDMGNRREVPVDVEGFPLERDDPLRPGTTLLRHMSRAAELTGDYFMTLRLHCPGYWLEAGTKHRAEKLFVIQVEVLKNEPYIVTLYTYSDAWLPLGIRGHEQVDVYEANAPRLAAALRDISALLGVPVEPGDMNRFASPTESGFEDPRDEGPAFDDSWGIFESPRQYQRLEQGPGRTGHEYEVFTEHPVRYLAVRRGERVLGYLWVSVAGDAVGYEPRTAAGDEAFEAGARWVALLGAAHREGLTAIAAFERLLGLPPEEERGTFAGRTPEEAPSLDALQDLSGRY
ncbi:hypothetical protein [Streptomyces uncialis]|uniref:hypothetical protein n=1 Tax=Streptomyces uncialis TaxID=1048205 RepID=UPI0038644BB7|nr:hypothetical protein OG268_20450 [Streptomyces uncialis]